MSPSPIGRLPLELLLRSIKLSLASSRDIRRVEQLRLVCSLWRDSINSCPSFWSQLSGAYTRPQLKQYIDRSAEAPIDIFNAVPQHLLRLLEASLPHVQRWRSAHLTLESVELAQSLTLPAPALETLVLATVPPRLGDGPVRVPILFAAHTPRLRSLKLVHVLPGRAAWLGGLTTLDVGCPLYHPSWKEIKSVLESCLALERLLLRFKDLPDGEDTSLSDPTTPIHLLHLRQIQLVLCGALFQKILLHVQAPRCHKMDLKSTIAGITVPPGPTFHFLLEHMQESTSLQANFGDGGILISNCSQSLRLFLRPSITPDSPADIGNKVFLDLITLVDRANKPTTLVVGPDRNFQRTFFARLASPRLSVDNRHLSWPLPLLVALYVETSESTASSIIALTKLIRRRTKVPKQVPNGHLGKLEVHLPNQQIKLHCRHDGWAFLDVTEDVAAGAQSLV